MEQTIQRGRIREPKVVSAKRGTWNAKARSAFLDHLAATCNVRAACAAAGRHYTGAYALRRRDPEFAGQWQGALESGYDTLEAALLERALRPLEQMAIGEGPPLPGDDFDAEQAMKLLAQHRTHQGRGLRPARRGGAAPDVASDAETDAAILKQLARLDARTRRKRGGA